jgi:hypothetical protein
MTDNSPDYVWHFRLSDHQPPKDSDPLTEMIRQQLCALLGCVVLTRNGQDIRITGFRLLTEPGHDHLLYPE